MIQTKRMIKEIIIIRARIMSKTNYKVVEHEITLLMFENNHFFFVTTIRTSIIEIYTNMSRSTLK